MAKRYLVRFADEHPDKALEMANKYLADIDDKKSPISDVQIANIEYHNAWYHIYLLITEQ